MCNEGDETATAAKYLMTTEHGEGGSRVQQPNQPRQTDGVSSLLELGGAQDGGDNLEGAERIGRERGGGTGKQGRVWDLLLRYQTTGWHVLRTPLALLPPPSHR